MRELAKEEVMSVSGNHDIECTIPIVFWISGLFAALGKNSESAVEVIRSEPVLSIFVTGIRLVNG